MNQTLIRRNTLILPAVISFAIYVTISFKVTHGLEGISDAVLLGLSNFMGLLIPLYASSLLWMKFIEDEGAVPFVDAKVVKITRAVLNIFCPIALAIFSGLMSTMTADNPWPVVRAIQLPLIVASTHVATLVLLVLGVLFGAILMFPVQWLLGIKEVTPTSAPQGESGTANTPSAERQPSTSQPQEEEKVYPFNWSEPTGGLSSMAGMADFKNEIERFITPYRLYKTRRDLSRIQTASCCLAPLVTVKHTWLP